MRAKCAKCAKCALAEMSIAYLSFTYIVPSLLGGHRHHEYGGVYTYEFAQSVGRTYESIEIFSSP